MVMNMHKNSTTHTIALAVPAKPDKTVWRMFIATFSTLVILLALLWSQNLFAADKKAQLNQDPAIQAEAADFIQHLADKALVSLSQKGASLADLEARFRKILTEGFDVKYISKISLGRHRKQASKNDLKTYYTLFPEYLVRVYTSRLSKLDTRKVDVIKVLPNGKRDMYVRTIITDGEGKTFDVDWRVRPQKTTAEAPEDRHYKIIDVKIEGISMARTQRDDFASRIAASGISGLITFMHHLVDGSVMVADSKDDAKQTTR